jgi:hypothetical protein
MAITLAVIMAAPCLANWHHWDVQEGAAFTNTHVKDIFDAEQERCYATLYGYTDTRDTNGTGRITWSYRVNPWGATNYLDYLTNSVTNTVTFPDLTETYTYISAHVITNLVQTNGAGTVATNTVVEQQTSSITLSNAACFATFETVYTGTNGVAVTNDNEPMFSVDLMAAMDGKIQGCLSYYFPWWLVDSNGTFELDYFWSTNVGILNQPDQFASPITSGLMREWLSRLDMNTNGIWTRHVSSQKWTVAESYYFGTNWFFDADLAIRNQYQDHIHGGTYPVLRWIRGNNSTSAYSPQTVTVQGRAFDTTDYNDPNQGIYAASDTVYAATTNDYALTNYYKWVTNMVFLTPYTGEVGNVYSVVYDGPVTSYQGRAWLDVGSSWIDDLHAEQLRERYKVLNSMIITWNNDSAKDTPTAGGATNVWRGYGSSSNPASAIAIATAAFGPYQIVDEGPKQWTQSKKTSTNYEAVAISSTCMYEIVHCDMYSATVQVYNVISGYDEWDDYDLTLSNGVANIFLTETIPASGNIYTTITQVGSINLGSPWASTNADAGYNIKRGWEADNARISFDWRGGFEFYVTNGM